MRVCERYAGLSRGDRDLASMRLQNEPWDSHPSSGSSSPSSPRSNSSDSAPTSSSSPAATHPPTLPEPRRRLLSTLRPTRLYRKCRRPTSACNRRRFAATRALLRAALTSPDAVDVADLLTQPCHSQDGSNGQHHELLLHDPLHTDAAKRELDGRHAAPPTHGLATRSPSCAQARSHDPPAAQQRPQAAVGYYLDALSQS